MMELLLGVFIGINWVFPKHGQTIGKKAARIIPDPIQPSAMITNGNNPPSSPK